MAFDPASRTTALAQGLRLLALAAVLATGACADQRGGPIPYKTSLGVPDAPAVAPLEATYRIAPLDVLDIRVFKNPDLSGDYEVDLTGTISVPMIGSVQAADLTPSQVRTELTNRLGEKYLEHPDVSVGIKSSTRKNITVDGSVNHPGFFPVTGPTTLIQIVAQAGGTAPDANPRRTAIFRQVAGRREAAAFDLTSIRRGEAPDPQVYAGDIVVIDGSSTKAAQKQILNSLPILSIFRPF